ncbi:MAG: rhodanese-like domain-containing protein [Lysobacterales bacterium]
MGLKAITPAVLQQMVRDRPVSLFDVNAQHSWSKARVPGARRIDHARFSEVDLPVDRRAALVFYCSNPLCSKAPLAARRAERMGYLDVRVMPAGISGWIASGLPVESGD